MIITNLGERISQEQLDAYVKQQEHNAKYELAQVEVERQARINYKKGLIDDIQKFYPNKFSTEYLNRQRVKTLERIYDSN